MRSASSGRRLGRGRVTSLFESLERRQLLAAAFDGLLDPALQPKFVNPLPNPLADGFVYKPAGNHKGSPLYKIGMYEIEQPLGLRDADGNPLVTTVWGYGTSQATATYPGKSFVADRNAPIYVQYTNNLPVYDNESGHLLPVDTSTHWAFSHDSHEYFMDQYGRVPTLQEDGVPVVPHLHGGHTRWQSDGLPEAYFTPGYGVVGPDIGIGVGGVPHDGPTPFYYANDQEAGTLWYHDHALGLTRLNVYAGLAGFYILRDGNEAQANLPKGPQEIPIVIQDRMFTGDGQLYYPSKVDEFYAPEDGVTWPADETTVLPEFFGDTILVNGQAWPKVDVEPRRYRLRLLNGSDSRVYHMKLSIADAAGNPTDQNVTFYQVGTDTGLLNTPVALSDLTLAPGERADVVVDFAGLTGKRVIVTNDATAPFKGPGGEGDPAYPETTSQLWAFDVNRRLRGGDKSANPALGNSLRPKYGPIQPLVQTGATRQLGLYENMDPYNRMLPMLGTVEDGPLAWAAPITENPQVGDVEVWEIYNFTEDTHPAHLHLVSFQVLSRQAFEFETVEMNGMEMVDPDSIELGDVLEVAANQKGWKDTVQVHPGEVVRVIAKFDKPGLYVWHCHILSHEDNEMMRPYFVGTIPQDVLDRYTGGGMHAGGMGDDAGMEALQGTLLAAAGPAAAGPTTFGDTPVSITDLLRSEEDVL